MFEDFTKILKHPCWCGSVSVQLGSSFSFAYQKVLGSKTVWYKLLHAPCNGLDSNCTHNVNVHILSMYTQC